MAFPVPDHLPRKSIAKDVSTEILTKVSEATTKTLTSSLVTSWVEELETSVQNTKTRIHERITAELPEFERQLQSSKSVQARLIDLSSNVSELSQAVHDPTTGLLPSLLKTLTEHSDLAQETLNNRISLDVLKSLSQLRDGCSAVRSLANVGDLAEAAAGCVKLLADVQDVPAALTNAKIMNDVKRDLRSLRDRVQEQLSDAYNRSVRMSLTELTICPIVKVRRSKSSISLEHIMSSLSSDSLDLHLATLRRDLVAKFIELPLQQPMSSSVDFSAETDGSPSRVLRLIPSTPTPERYVLRHLETLFTFLSENFISVLPPSHRESFPRTLCKPTTQAILLRSIHPSLPSSLSELPSFLDFLDEAVSFEEEYISRLLCDNTRGEPEIKGWATGVAAHYGQKRREDILNAARELILSDITNAAARGERVHQVEMEIVDAHEEPGDAHWGGMPNVVPVQGDVDENTGNGWDFEHDLHAIEGDTSTDVKSHEEISEPSESVEDGWGLDDDAVADDSTWDFDSSPKDDIHQEVATNGNGRHATSPDLPPLPIIDDADNADASAAWGWDEDESNIPGLEDDDEPAGPLSDHNGNEHAEGSNSDDGSKGDNSSWDDPWAEQENEPNIAKSSPASEVKQPKLAKRLEKFSKVKSKTTGAKDVQSVIELDNVNSSAAVQQTSFFPRNPTLSSPSTLSSINVPEPSSSAHSLQESSQGSKRRPPGLPFPRKRKKIETYLITELAKDLIRDAREIISEGRATASSIVIARRTTPSSSSTSPAQFILQSAPLIFDLYRALYPIAASKLLSNDQARAMRFSNDCIYLSEQINIIDVRDLPRPLVVDQLHEVSERLRSLGDWWHENNIERQCAAVRTILAKAEGFVDTGLQDRYDECEAVMTETLRSIRSVAHQWKGTLSRTKYYSAVGHLVNFALATVVNAVLALPDIPEVDSQRLSELSRILNALEGLFVEDHEEASFVVSYVPTWLKYSYLSELLEASIADISYLFDEGALIDFEVEELISLVKALFADTQLRSNTIEKLRRGHPVVK